jgi:hypothetical protein
LGHLEFLLVHALDVAKVFDFNGHGVCVKIAAVTKILNGEVKLGLFF